MTLRSEEYWEKRAAARMDRMQSDAMQTLRKMDRAYRSAEASMLVQIRAMVKAFGRRYGLTEEEAAEILKKPASQESLEALTMAVRNMPEGREKQKKLAELNAPGARYRINNVQAMREQTQAVCSRLAHEEKRLFTDSLTKAVRETYLHTAYDIQMGVGLSWKTTGISDQVVRQLLREDWSGVYYQTRIMGRYGDLAEEMSTLMLEGMLGGRSREQMIDEMRHRFAMNAKDARRLLVTETTYVVNAAELEVYKEDGIKEYVYMAILDLKTSDICATLDGMVFKIEYAKAGKNYPPMHPNCRSTTGPVLDRAALARMMRKATDPITGELMTLPPNTSYKDWYKMLVDKHGEKRLTGGRTSRKQTGGKHKRGTVRWQDHRDELAEKKYEAIRKANDVNAVAQASGMSIEEVRHVKSHVFFNAHKLYDGYKRFSADYDMAVAWQRLANGQALERDILLLKHELLEYRTEKVYNITNEEAHRIADKTYPWYTLVLEECGEYGEADDLLQFD